MLPCLLSALIGVWLFAAPNVLEYGGAARTTDQVVGPIVASFAVIAVSEVTRGLRWVNGAIGLLLVAAPLLLRFDGTPLLVNLTAGVALLVLARLGGRIQGRHGGGWRALLREPAGGER